MRKSQYYLVVFRRQQGIPKLNGLEEILKVGGHVEYDGSCREKQGDDSGRDGSK